MQDFRQHQFKASQIARVPYYSGLYAWYYKPLIIDEESIIKTLTSFIDTSTKVFTKVEMRYGLKLISESRLKAEFGSQKQSAFEVIDQVVKKSDNFFSDFFKSSFVQNFSRPIYIGIAKNLNTRVYSQHYSSLIEMYDITSPVNRYLSLHPDSTVQEVMDDLDLPHSFALEARVRNIAPRDLVVNVFITDSLPEDIGSDSEDPQFDTPSRRALERLLQLVADPICGRR